MTEAEWNACTDPTPMLEFLRRMAKFRGRRSQTGVWERGDAQEFN